MPSDIRFLQQLDFPAYAVTLDWLMTDQNMIADGYDLQSAVIVALGSDALAPPDEELPDPDSADRRGWWGDLDVEELWGGWPVGCLLWLLQRAKITGPLADGGGTVSRADGWTRDAMQPFIDRRIASRIEVDAERVDIDRIDVGVTIYRGPEPAIELRYAELWDEMANPEASGIVPPPPQSAWSFNDKNPNIGLAGGNLIAYVKSGAVPVPGRAFAVRSTVGHNTGKWYFEVRWDAVAGGNLGNIEVGATTAEHDLAHWLGDLTAGGYSAGYQGSGHLYIEGVPIPTGMPMALGKWAGFAVHFEGANAWVRTPAGWVTGPPAAGTRGALQLASPKMVIPTIYAAVALYTFGDQATANFGASPFAYPVPPGFTAWDK